jgi:hypothetical protein
VHRGPVHPVLDHPADIAAPAALCDPDTEPIALPREEEGYVGDLLDKPALAIVRQIRPALGAYSRPGELRRDDQHGSCALCDNLEALARGSHLAFS